MKTEQEINETTIKKQFKWYEYAIAIFFPFIVAFIIYVVLE